MSEHLKDFPVVLKMEIRWGDMDAMRHVNNTLFFRYFESSRIELFRKVKNYMEIRKRGTGVILAYTFCKFKAPLQWPDTIYVGAKVLSVDKSKIIIQHKIVSEKLDREAAEGEAHLVWYNYNDQEKGELPEGLEKEFLSLGSKK
jgi:acyl-CoA thioester hydrolase